MRTGFALCDDLGMNLSRVSSAVPVGRGAIPVRSDTVTVVRDSVAVVRNSVAVRVMSVQRHVPIGRGHMTI